MLSILLTMFTSCVIVILCQAAGLAWGWCMLWGGLSLLAGQIGVALIIRRKIMSVNKKIQMVLETGRLALNRRMTQLQSKPMDEKAMMGILQKEQSKIVKDALEMVSLLEPYKKWVFNLSKQIDTMRMQFNYQLGDFEKVDQLMPNCVFGDAMTTCMKMARMHVKGETGIDDLYQKKIKKLKGANGTLLYALYAWILVKRKEQEKALKILSTAKDLTGDETLRRNWEALANEKGSRYSNHGLGELWYSLRLEDPPRPKKVKPQRGNPFR